MYFFLLFVWMFRKHIISLRTCSRRKSKSTRASEKNISRRLLIGRFAKNVWGINGDGMTDQQIAEAGLEALKNWMLEIGLPVTISEIGATPDMIPGITEGTICYPAGYLDLKPEDITEILKESM